MTQGVKQNQRFQAVKDNFYSLHRKYFLFFFLSRDISLLGENCVNALLITVLYSYQQYCNDSEQENNGRAAIYLGLVFIERQVFTP